MRRVLILTGSWAPTMIADMQRARQLVWRLAEYGWHAEVLSPDASFQPPSCLDQDSAEFFASDITAHQVGHPAHRFFRALGVGGIGWRTIWPMWRAGRKLLASRHYDLVYISTAQFLLFLLGPAWHRQFGISYVLDLHDPPYQRNAQHRHLKQRVAGRTSKHLEFRAVTAASGLISVSPVYLERLYHRYAGEDPAWLAAGRRAVIPFGYLHHDLEEASRSAPERRDSAPSAARIVYVGTGGTIMIRAFTLLCQVLSRLRARRDHLVDKVRIELHGTASAVGLDTEPHLARVAQNFGVDDLVTEKPGRVTYRRSVELLLGADGALILGVDDVGYMPSKLFTYAASGLPLLASVQRDGPALATFATIPRLGHAVWFGERDMPIDDAADVVAAFLAEVVGRRRFDRESDLRPYTASAMARRHAELFDACLDAKAKRRSPGTGIL
jgi:hypothetical protein